MPMEYIPDWPTTPRLTIRQENNSELISFQYTGAHKERFNTDGSGKGKAGREELIEQTGYVASYKNKDTYDKAHGAAK